MNAVAMSAMPTTDGLKRQIVDETILSPRFYTTDFAALDRFDVGPVRDEWEILLGQMEADPNRLHFRRRDRFTGIVEALEPDVRDEFIEFLLSSMTSEFSGCIFYSEIARRTNNPDIKRLMKLLTRDESRHAGFIRDSLKDAGLPISLDFLTKAKKYHHFRPKFILYATYLSEKIGYARYIAICRHLEQHPANNFHPLFDRFEEWCNDEYRHGEAIALLIRADPKLTRGVNRLWIRFFLVSVYATMYCRDHMRPALHRAMGLDITDYDYQVFKICTEISRQVFPVLLDTDNPKFRVAMEAMRGASLRLEAARQKTGARRMLARASASVAVGWAFIRLMSVRVLPNALPARVLRAATW